MPEAHQISPFDLVAIEDETHALYCKRVHAPVKRHLVRSIERNGFFKDKPILYKKCAEGLVIVKGRQRNKAARHVAKQTGTEDTLKVWALEFNGNMADAQLQDTYDNAAVVEFTPSHQASKAQTLMNLGHSKKEVAMALDLTQKSVDDYLKYNGVSQLVKNAVDFGEKVTYKDPKTGEEKQTSQLVTLVYADVIADRVWLLNEDEQTIWVRKQYKKIARGINRKQAALLESKGIEVAVKEDDYPPVYGKKSFKVKALAKFAAAFTLSPPYDVDSPFAEEAATHVNVVQSHELMSDGFALGIEFAIGKMMMLFDKDVTSDKLAEATGLDLTEEQIKAFQQLWILSQK